jgi:hypothetical protein
MSQIQLQKEVKDIGKRVSVIEAILERLENNHLAHIEKDMDTLNGRVWSIVILGLVQVSGIAAGLLYLLL